MMSSYYANTLGGPSTGALTHNEGVFVEAVLIKWLARVPSPSLLLLKVHFIINVRIKRKWMIPFVLYNKETKNHVGSPRARTVTYLSYSRLFQWGSSVFNLSTSFPASSTYDHPNIFIFDDRLNLFCKYARARERILMWLQPFSDPSPHDANIPYIRAPAPAVVSLSRTSAALCLRHLSVSLSHTAGPVRTNPTGLVGAMTSFSSCLQLLVH